MYNEKGFTVLELLISLAVMAAIGTGVTASIFQVYKVTRQNNDYATAVQQAQNTGYWISHDGLMAETLTGNSSLVNEADKFVFSWSDWETGFTNVVEYSLMPSEDLYQVKRHLIIVTPAGNTTTERIISDHIVKVEKAGSPWRFTVTSLSGQKSVVREYAVASRLNFN